MVGRLWRNANLFAIRLPDGRRAAGRRSPGHAGNLRPVHRKQRQRRTRELLEVGFLKIDVQTINRQVLHVGQGGVGWHPRVFGVAVVVGRPFAANGLHTFGIALRGLHVKRNIPQGDVLQQTFGHALE